MPTVPWHKMRDNIKEVVIEAGVTAVGDYAFCRCSNLKKVTLPSTITRIGNQSFWECYLLESVNIPSAVTEIGVQALGWTRLTSVTIPDSVKKIGIFCFENCTSLKSVVFGKGCTVIADGMFWSCTALESVELPDSITEIQWGAFEYCESLKSISIPAAVKTIGEYAFHCCTSLSEITFPAGITKINDYTFGACSALTSFTIPENVTYVGEGAFASTGLTQITIPAKVTELGAGAFRDCTSLQTVYFNGNLPDTSTVQFEGTEAEITEAYTFKEVTANVYYPLGGTGWTASAPADFGGTLTMIPYGEVSGTCGENLTWTLTAEGVLTISGTGAMTNYVLDSSASTAPWIGLGVNIVEIIIEDGVTSIGNNAFYKCTGVEKVTIGAKVSTIGTKAFYRCSVLKDIIIRGNLSSDMTRDVFGSCSSDKDIYVAEGVTSIPQWLFTVDHIKSYTAADGNTVYTSRDGVLFDKEMKTLINYPLAREDDNYPVPDGVTTIASYAFESKYGVKGVTLPESITTLEDRAFQSCYEMKFINIPSGVTQIGAYVFAGCTALESMVIPDGITAIGEQAFVNCTGMTELTIGKGVKSIGTKAFYDCEGLESITINGDIESLGTDVFYGVGAKTLYIGSEVTKDIITYAGLNEDLNAFGSLEEIVVSENNSSYTAQDGVLFNKDMTTLLYYPQSKADVSYEVPEGVETIADYAFYYQGVLQNVTMADDVLNIGNSAFKSTNITSIDFSENLTSIGEYAFSSVKGINPVIIPEKVNNIGTYAFWALGSTEAPASVYFLGDFPATAGSYIFRRAYVNLYYMADAEGWTASNLSALGSEASLWNTYAYEGDAGNCGTNLTWTLEPGGVLRISGTGAMTDYDNSNPSPWQEHCSEITKVIIEEGVTSIGANAFSDCINLTSVEIAGSVTSIGDYAFFECAALTQITIPDSVTSIGAYAFYGCGLTSVVIPASITSIGDSAFQGTVLTEVVFLGTCPTIGDYAFSVNTETISISYPEGDTTWSNVDSMSDLGGVSSENSIGDVSDENITIGAHTHTWTTVTKAATCTSAGSVTKTCDSCGAVTTETIAKLGHSYSSTVTKAATCSAAGVRTYTCSRCSSSYTKTIAATGHTASSSWTMTKAATCTATGTQVKKCTKCSAAVKTQTIAAKGHSWSAWKETAAATVFEPKHEQRTCSTCKTTASRCTGNVLEPTIKLNAYNIPLKTGQSTTKVKVSGLANGDYVKSWKSSNTFIVKVNASSGKITAQKKKGTAKVTVTLASGKTETVTVKVQKTAVKTTAIMIVGYTKYTVNKGKKLDLAATMQPSVLPITSLQKITYSSSNKKVATVSSKGVVTAKAAGTAKITIKSGSVKDVVTITVPKTKTTSITGVPASLSLKKGKTYTLKVKAKPSNSDYPVTYKTSNKKVATITSKGKIKGVKKGTATITVKSGSKSVKCKVTVK